MVRILSHWATVAAVALTLRPVVGSEAESGFSVPWSEQEGSDAQTASMGQNFFTEGSATFIPSEGETLTRLSRHLSNVDSSKSGDAPFGRRLSYHGLDSHGGHVAFEGSVAVKEQVISLDSLGSAESIECDDLPGVGRAVSIRIRGNGLAGLARTWAPGHTILVAGSQWGCGEGEDTKSPLYVRISDSPSSVRVETLAGGITIVMVSTTRVSMQDCFHSLAFDLKRNNVAKQPKHGKGGRGLLSGSPSIGFVPFTWELGQHAVGKATWNVAPMMNFTVDEAPITTAQRRVTIANTGGHLITCIDCYAWVAADVNLRGEFGWGSANSLDIYAGVYTSSRFEVEAILSPTIAFATTVTGYNNITTFNATDGTSTTVMEPIYTTGITESSPIPRLPLMYPTRVMTIEFLASGVPVSVPVSVRMDLDLALTYLPPVNTTNITTPGWSVNGVVTSSGLEASGRAVLGASCKAGKGCGPVRSEGLTVKAMRPMYDLPGPGTTRLSIRVAPAFAITASVFGSWDVTMTIQPYTESTALTGPDVARQCGPVPAFSLVQSSYNNTRVFATLSRGMTGTIHLDGPGAVLTMGPACQDGRGCAGPFTFSSGPRIKGMNYDPLVLGPYALVPEDAVPSSSAFGCVGNGVAYPTYSTMTNGTGENYNTLNNASALCSMPGVCTWEAGAFDGVCSVDCGGPGILNRTVRCRARISDYTFLVPKDSCLASPTAGRAPLGTSSCNPSSFACGTAKIYRVNPVFPSARCNESLTTPYYISTSRQCSFVPELGSWVFAQCVSSNIFVYTCTRADCPKDDPLVCTLAQRTVDPLEGTFVKDTCDLQSSLLGGISYEASCPSYTLDGNSVNKLDFLPVGLDGGRTVSLQYTQDASDTPSATPPPWRYYSFQVSGAVDSVAFSSTIVRFENQNNPPVSARDFTVFMASSPFECSNDGRPDVIACVPGTSAKYKAPGIPVGETSGLDVELGAADNSIMVKTVTGRATTVTGWGRAVYVAVRCFQSCTFSGTAYSRSAPGESFVSSVRLLPLESRFILYRPSPSAVGMSVMVTTLGPGGPSSIVSSQLIVRASNSKQRFEFPKISDLGRPNVTASSPLGISTALILPATAVALANVDTPTRGLTLLMADGFNPTQEFLVTLLSNGNDTTRSASADHLMQGFDLLPLTPGEPISMGLPALNKVAFVLNVPASSSGLTVKTTLVKGNAKVCVSPGVGLYDLRACGSTANSVNTLYISAAGSSWLAGSRELTVLLSALTDVSFTLVALPQEVLDHGVPVTRTVRKGSRLTFASPTEIVPSIDRISGYERLGWSARLAVAGQAPAPVSMFAGTLSEYPNLPSESASEASAQAVMPGAAVQVSGQYLVRPRVQPVMLSIVSAANNALLTGTFTRDQTLTSEMAAQVPQGPVTVRRLTSGGAVPPQYPTGASMTIDTPDMYIWAPWANAWRPGNSSTDNCAASAGVAATLASSAKDYGNSVCAEVWLEPAFATASSLANLGIVYMVMLPPSTQAQIQLLSPGNASSGTAGTAIWSICAEGPARGASCTSADEGLAPIIRVENCGSLARGFRINILPITPLATALSTSPYTYLTVAHRPASPSAVCPGYSWRLGGWGKCGEYCKASVQNRTVTCTETVSGMQVDEYMCPFPRPTAQKACNHGPCVILKSDWSECPRPCVVTGQNAPFQYRTAACFNGGGKGILVRDSFCTQYFYNATTGAVNNVTSIANTALSQVCPGLLACQIPLPPAAPTGYWWIGDWTACSAACDGGIQTRPVYCADGNGVAVDDVWCMRNTRPPTSRVCGMAPCAGSEVEVTFADVRKLLPNTVISSLRGVEVNQYDSISAGGMRFYSVARIYPSDQAMCLDVSVQASVDICTSSALAEASSCASSLQACLAAVTVNMTRMFNSGTLSLLPFGIRKGTQPFVDAASTCACYAAAQVCAATKKCGSVGSPIESLASGIAADCATSVCPTLTPSACNARPDIAPQRLGNNRNVVHIFANRMKPGQILSDVPLPTGHGTSELHMGSLAAGRQSLCINGSAFGTDTEGMLFGVKATEGGVSVSVTAFVLNGTEAGYTTLAGSLYWGERYEVNTTIYPQLAYNYLAQKLLPVTNLTWRMDIIDTHEVRFMNVTNGGLELDIILLFDAFVDPNLHKDDAVATYGMSYNRVSVHPNALLTAIRATNPSGMPVEGGWDKVALPYLLNASTKSAVELNDGQSVAIIRLPAIPGYKPRMPETLTLTIPGQFLRSGRDLPLTSFKLVVNTTDTRDCSVGKWVDWSLCPALPCAGPGISALGGVPYPKTVQFRSRPLLLSPMGPTAVQCPVLVETRPCDPCNPCSAVKCDNGGMCIEGKCVCPPGYGGPDCSLPPPSLSICTSWADTQWSTCLNAARNGGGARVRYVNCSCATAGLLTNYTIINGTAIMGWMTPTPTASPSATVAASDAPTGQPSATSTTTVTSTGTPSTSSTRSQDPTPTGTPTNTPTPSQTSTVTASNSNTPSQRSSLSPTPSVTPSNGWWYLIANATNATAVPVPVYAPLYCGLNVPVPSFMEDCPVPVPAVGEYPSANTTVMRVTVPLLESAWGVNGTNLLSHAVVHDAWAAALVRHIGAAAAMATGQLVPVGVSRCAPLNFVPSGQSLDGYVRATASVSPYRNVWTARTPELAGSPPVICMTLEYIEDTTKNVVTATHFLYRLAVLLGAGVDKVDRTGGVDLRPIIVTGLLPNTHLLAPFSQLASSAGKGYVNYTFLAVKGDPFGRPEGGLKPTGMLTDMPGVSAGFMPQPPLGPADLRPLTFSLIAFVALFVTAVAGFVIYLRRRGLTDRAPRPKNRPSAMKTKVGETVNPLRRGSGLSVAATIASGGYVGMHPPHLPHLSLPHIHFPGMGHSAATPAKVSHVELEMASTGSNRLALFNAQPVPVGASEGTVVVNPLSQYAAAAAVPVPIAPVLGHEGEEAPLMAVHASVPPVDGQLPPSAAGSAVGTGTGCERHTGR